MTPVPEVAEEERLRLGWYSLLARLLGGAPDSDFLASLRALEGDATELGQAVRTLAQVAEAAGQPFPDVLLEIGPRGGSAAHFVMDEALQARLMLDPYVAIASDGSPGGSHPRGAGTFAKWIEEFAVRDGLVTLEEAVRKCTGLPASILRLADRGLVREGAVADLVLFDPARVRARADYVDPTAQAEGFDLVLVNGVPAFEGGERVVSAGKMLRHGSVRRASAA